MTSSSELPNEELDDSGKYENGNLANRDKKNGWVLALALNAIHLKKFVVHKISPADQKIEVCSG